MFEIIGGVFVIAILAVIPDRLLKNKLSQPKRAYTCAAIATFLAVPLGAFGLANGGSPVWAESTLIYTPAAVIYSGLVIAVFNKQKQE